MGEAGQEARNSRYYLSTTKHTGATAVIYLAGEGWARCQSGGMRSGDGSSGAYIPACLPGAQSGFGDGGKMNQERRPRGNAAGQIWGSILGQSWKRVRTTLRGQSITLTIAKLPL